MVKAGRVRIILGIGAVGDHKNLHKLIKSAGCPKAVPLVAVDLVKGLPDGNAPVFQFNMDQRQTVDQHCHIIAVSPSLRWRRRTG